MRSKLRVSCLSEAAPVSRAFLCGVYDWVLMCGPCERPKTVDPQALVSTR